MRELINIQGQRFNRLFVVSRAESRMRNGIRGDARWNCVCDCGNRSIVVGYDLRRGYTKSCGCLGQENLKAANWKHGYTGTALYRTWHDMKVRCMDPKRHNFSRYGGRGIRVCSEWEIDAKTFIQWALSHGYREGLQIDRKDNDGDYSPYNCRFVEGVVNARNRPQCKDHKDFVRPPFRGNQYIKGEDPCV